MDLKEMNDKIHDFCVEHYCDDCALRDAGLSPCWFQSDSPDLKDKIERRYKILFGSDESEKVNHPAHYQGKHECIDEMIALFGVDAVKGFCRCNVHKYRYRANAKGGQEDLDKANWYMDKLIELERGKA